MTIKVTLSKTNGGARRHYKLLPRELRTGTSGTDKVSITLREPPPPPNDFYPLNRHPAEEAFELSLRDVDVFVHAVLGEATRLRGVTLDGELIPTIAERELLEHVASARGIPVDVFVKRAALAVARAWKNDPREDTSGIPWARVEIPGRK